jgi:hypothetical protein
MDTMHNKQQKSITLVAKLVKGQENDGEALAQALFSQLPAFP